MQILVSIGAVDPQIGEMLPPCDFFDCPVMSCPYLPSYGCDGGIVGTIGASVDEKRR